MPLFCYLIDYSIPICRLLLYSLSVLISVTMSLPEECPSFKDPSSPIGRVQSGLAALILFESGNNVQANLPNNNIYKGKWTEKEHKIFMQEYEKYGNNCMQIKKVLSTWTPAQIQKHAECFFKRNLKTNSAAMKRYRESLSPDKKHKFFLKMSLNNKTIDSLYHQKKNSKFMQWCWCTQKTMRVPFSWEKGQNFTNWCWCT